MKRITLLLHITLLSLKNRMITAGLTVFVIALSTSLLLGTEIIKQSARNSFSSAVSGIDLVVGPRTGSLQLLLYTVFHMGSPVANISAKTWKEIDSMPETAWTIPVSLGDSHKGYRVVGTNENMYKYFAFHKGQKIEFADGTSPSGVFDAALGSEAAKNLHYKTGQSIVISHGITTVGGIADHKDKPFTVTGILKATGTPLDRAVFVTLEGLEAVHVDWKDGGVPLDKDRISADTVLKMNHEGKLAPQSITAFFLKSKSRVLSLKMMREFNTRPGEPLMAVLPGLTLSELWRSLMYGEAALRAISIAVLIVAYSGMFMVIYTSLNERRREMAILRAVGATPSVIISLLSLESFILSIIGTALGVIFTYIFLYFAEPWIRTAIGLNIPPELPGLTGWIYIGAIITGGLFTGMIPAIRAYRMTLADGLTIKI
jgi:putative ABC transport system permease protein